MVAGGAGCHSDVALSVCNSLWRLLPHLSRGAGGGAPTYAHVGHECRRKFSDYSISGSVVSVQFPALCLVWECHVDLRSNPTRGDA